MVAISTRGKMCESDSKTMRRSLCKTLISAERGWLWGGSSTSVFWSQDDFEWNGRVRRKHVRNLSQFTQQNSGLNCFLCTFSVLGFLGTSLKPNNLESAPPTESPKQIIQASATNGRKRCFWAFRVPTSTACICGTVGTSWCKLKCAHAPPGHAWGSIGQSFTCVVAVSSPMRFVIWGGNSKHSKNLLKATQFKQISWIFANSMEFHNDSDDETSI